MWPITAVTAREVLDSRSHPTVEVDVWCCDVNGTQIRGRASVPSGASTGSHEAVELRDGDPRRYSGMGVLRAVQNVNDVIGPKIKGINVAAQIDVDSIMIHIDGTPNKSRLGANAMLGVSLACAHAATTMKRLPLHQHIAEFAGDHLPPTLPIPMVNMISGGLHAGGNLDVQDVLIMPVAARSYSEALRWSVEVYAALQRLLAQRGLESALVGDEGGFGPRLPENESAIAVVVDAIEAAGREPGREVGIAIDVASTQFCTDGCYLLRHSGDVSRNANEMVQLLESWVDRYPIVSIEDGCAEDDWEGWRSLTDRLGSRVQLIGDDLFVTNPSRLARGIQGKIANAVLVKPNQIGTLTETVDLVRQAVAAGYRVVISARSGETEDTTIAHLAVGTGAGQIKIGSVARSERLAKYNELLRIEEQLGSGGTLSTSPPRGVS